GTGRGELLTRLRLLDQFRAVIAVPEWRVSTPRAFQVLERVRKRLTRWRHHLRFARTVGRQRVEALSLVRRGNEFAALLGRRRRASDALRAVLRAAGLLEPRMTGSGSAVFAIGPSGASVRGIVARFRGDEPLFAVRSVGRGLRLHVHSSAAKPRKGVRADDPPK